MNPSDLESPLDLQKGESIIKEIRPSTALKWKMLLNNLVIIGFLSAFIIYLYYYEEGSLWRTIGLLLFSLFEVRVIIQMIGIPIIYKKRLYLVTDKRVVVNSGFIGNYIHSVPLERISDIAVSRSFEEKMFGFGGLRIRTLTAGGAGVSLEALPDPENTKNLIFDLVERKREREKLTM